MSGMRSPFVRRRVSRSGIDLTPGKWRAFYEVLGCEAIVSGTAIQCATEPIIDILCRMIEDSKGSFATGYGASVTYDALLDSHGKRVVGLKFTDFFLEMAKHVAHSRIAQADATAPPFPATSLDSVLCSEMLMHVPDDRSAVAEIHRILRPRGCTSSWCRSS